MMELPHPQRVQVTDNYEDRWDSTTPYDTSLRGLKGHIEAENTNNESLVRFDDGGSTWIPDHYLINID